MDTEHWLLRERVVEAVALVETVRSGDAPPGEQAQSDLAAVRAELASLTSVVCEDGSDAAEACDAGRGAMEAIDGILTAEPRAADDRELRRSAA